MPAVGPGLEQGAKRGLRTRSEPSGEAAPQRHAPCRLLGSPRETVNRAPAVVFYSVTHPRRCLRFILVSLQDVAPLPILV